MKCPQCNFENDDTTSRCVKCSHLLHSDIINMRTRKVAEEIVRYYFSASVFGIFVIFAVTILANFGVLLGDSPLVRMPPGLLWGLFTVTVAVILSALRGFSQEMHRDKKNKIFFRYANLINVLFFIYIIILLYYTIR